SSVMPVSTPETNNLGARPCVSNSNPCSRRSAPPVSTTIASVFALSLTGSSGMMAVNHSNPAPHTVSAMINAQLISLFPMLSDNFLRGVQNICTYYHRLQVLWDFFHLLCTFSCHNQIAQASRTVCGFHIGQRISDKRGVLRLCVIFLQCLQ